MIVILCKSFDDARSGFARFMNYLECCDPLSISKVFEYSYCVETDDNFRYIFVDYRFKPLFHTFDRPDEIELDEFFECLDEIETVWFE